MPRPASKRQRNKSAPRLFTWRALRISLLTLLLAMIAWTAWLTRLHATDWNRPLWVVAFPINADGSAVTAAYIDTLTRESFAPIEQYLTEQARGYGLTRTAPLEIRLGPRLAKSPPSPPYGGSVLQVVAWSLHLRWWAWRAAGVYDGPPIDVRLFVLYHDPAQSPRLDHSLGLKEGMIGLANVFADRNMAGSNQVVIAHELLHTVGATDKYDPATSLPRYPDGYADPQRIPRYPQIYAELMGGRVPLSESAADIPTGLGKTRIGAVTAAEIGWRK